MRNRRVEPTDDTHGTLLRRRDDQRRGHHDEGVAVRIEKLRIANRERPWTQRPYDDCVDADEQARRVGRSPSDLIDRHRDWDLRTLCRHSADSGWLPGRLAASDAPMLGVAGEPALQLSSLRLGYRRAPRDVLER